MVKCYCFAEISCIIVKISPVIHMTYPGVCSCSILIVRGSHNHSKCLSRTSSTYVCWSNSNVARSCTCCNRNRICCTTGSLSPSGRESPVVSNTRNICNAVSLRRSETGSCASGDRGGLQRSAVPANNNVVNSNPPCSSYCTIIY